MADCLKAILILCESFLYPVLLNLKKFSIQPSLMIRIRICTILMVLKQIPYLWSLPFYRFWRNGATEIQGLGFRREFFVNKQLAFLILAFGFQTLVALISIVIKFPHFSMIKRKYLLNRGHAASK